MATRGECGDDELSKTATREYTMEARNRYGLLETT